jgi:TfoX/Sxy family transcriptional regulator of competence genes
MAFDPGIAEQVRHLLETRKDITERKMFGGLAFMVGGNMLCAIGNEHLMVRVGDAGHDAALARPHVREMRFTGRPMRGYVTVDPPGYATRKALQSWLETALSFVGALPRKGGRHRRGRPQAVRRHGSGRRENEGRSRKRFRRKGPDRDGS